MTNEGDRQQVCIRTDDLFILMAIAFFYGTSKDLDMDPFLYSLETRNGLNQDQNNWFNDGFLKFMESIEKGEKYEQ